MQIDTWYFRVFIGGVLQNRNDPVETSARPSDDSGEWWKLYDPLFERMQLIGHAACSFHLRIINKILVPVVLVGLNDQRHVVKRRILSSRFPALPNQSIATGRWVQPNRIFQTRSSPDWPIICDDMWQTTLLSWMYIVCQLDWRLVTNDLITHASLRRKLDRFISSDADCVQRTIRTTKWGWPRSID